MSYPKDREKRRQITYRISEVAEDRLQKASNLFDMEPAKYAKAVLYRDLGVFDEPLDKRRRRYKEKQRRQEWEDETFAEDVEITDQEEALHGRHSTGPKERNHRIR